MKRQGRIWLILGGLLLLAGGWWWATRPKSLQLVGTFGACGDDCFPPSETSGGGFLLRDINGDFCLHDWHTGQVRWRVTPAPDVWHIDRWYVWTSGGPGLFDGHSTYALSRNGRFFATATHTNGRMRVQIWADGTLSTDLLLPDAAFPQAKDCVYPLCIADSGRLYVDQECAVEYAGQPQFTVHAGLIESGKLVAIGDQTGTFDAKHDLLITTDGNNSAVYAVTAQHGTLVYTRLFRAKTLLMKALDRDTYLGQNRAIYTRAGGVHCYAAKHDIGFLQTNGDWAVSTPEKNQRSIVNMRTGAAWACAVLPAPLGSRGAALRQRSSLRELSVTADGRFAAVAQEMKPAIPVELLDWKRVHPRLLWWLPERRQLSLRVYERPGRWRAHLLEPLTTPGPMCTTIALSPDGHSVLLGPEEGAKGMQFRLFRW